jgi:hypothetical protein
MLPGGLLTWRCQLEYGADMPYLTPEYSDQHQNMFIAGELGDWPDQERANHGQACIDTITKRWRKTRTGLSAGCL